MDITAGGGHFSYPTAAIFRQKRARWSQKCFPSGAISHDRPWSRERLTPALREEIYRQDLPETVFSRTRLQASAGKRGSTGKRDPAGNPPCGKIPGPESHRPPQTAAAKERQTVCLCLSAEKHRQCPATDVRWSQSSQWNRMPNRHVCSIA